MDGLYFAHFFEWVFGWGFRKIRVEFPDFRIFPFLAHVGVHT